MLDAIVFQKNLFIMVTPLETDRPDLFVVPREQMGLLGSDFLPPLQPTAPNGHKNGIEGYNLAFPIEVRGRDGEIRQGVFERIPINELNVVVQQRDEYSGIQTLADNIKEQGRLIHAPLVARYDEEGARAYLNTAYGVYNRKTRGAPRKRISDLTSSGSSEKPIYHIVIAGHRRLRALRLIDQQDIVVQIVENIDPLDALELQVSENTARLPKDYERAESNGDLHVVMKARNPNLTLKEFAAKVGHPQQVVRRDLRYYSLPEEVKNYVVPRNRKDSGEGDTEIPDQPLMPFNVACQLGRLVEEGAQLPDVLFLARRFFEEGISSEKAAGIRVNAYIRESIRGAGDMQDIFGVNSARLARLKRTKQVAERFTGVVDDSIAYFVRVKQAEELGFADLSEDGISFGGAASRLVRLADTVGGILPHMERLLEEGKVEDIGRVFKEMRQMAQEFGSLIEEEPK